MLTIGVDAHKKLHVAVAVDEAGRVVGQWQGDTSPEGWDAVTAWARELGAVRRWGIEGAGSYGQGLARHLVGLGEVVYEVNSRLTAQGRRGARRPGKSDALDAAAIARAVLREGDALPRIQPADEAAILDLLATEREAAQAEATRLRNQVHALLHQLDPHYRRQIPSLITAAGLAALEQYQATSRHPLDQARAAVVRRLGQRLRLAVEQAAELAHQIEERAEARFSPLMGVYGVKGLTAGALAGILGQRRFASEAQLGPARRLCRRRPPGSLVGRRDAAPPESGWEPAPERHPVPHRPDPGALLAGRQAVRPAPHGGGQDLAGSDPRPQTLPHPGHLAPVAGMPAAPRRPVRHRRLSSPNALGRTPRRRRACGDVRQRPERCPHLHRPPPRGSGRLT